MGWDTCMWTGWTEGLCVADGVYWQQAHCESYLTSLGPGRNICWGMLHSARSQTRQQPKTSTSSYHDEILRATQSKRNNLKADPIPLHSSYSAIQMICTPATSRETSIQTLGSTTASSSL